MEEMILKTVYLMNKAKKVIILMQRIIFKLKLLRGKQFMFVTSATKVWIMKMKLQNTLEIIMKAS